jgi:NitT/TauT family transport system ATP-binding protein
MWGVSRAGNAAWHGACFLCVQKENGCLAMLQEWAVRHQQEQVTTAGALMTTERNSDPGVRDPLIEFEYVTLAYGRGESAVQALDETSIKIGEGDFVALVGPSGCGKSTILKLVGGLISATTGYVFVAGREIGAEDVRIGMAFQNPTLLPWLTVRQNVMLPLKIVQPFRADWARKRKNEYRDRAEALLAQVGLSGFGDKHPWQLSGGMQQRASLCRALIHDPTLLLLDEPFGALDQFTREELWAVLQELWLTRKPTVILVTHDLRESAFLSNRIVVMSARPGRVIDDETVPFARPRTIAMTYDPMFVALNQRLRSLIVEVRAGSEITLGAAA